MRSDGPATTPDARYEIWLSTALRLIFGPRGSAHRCDSLRTCLTRCDEHPRSVARRSRLTGAMHSIQRGEAMRLRIVGNRWLATVAGVTGPRRSRLGRICELSEQLSTPLPQSLRTRKKHLENAGFARCARALMTRLVHKPARPHVRWRSVATGVAVSGSSQSQRTLVRVCRDGDGGGCRRAVRRAAHLSTASQATVACIAASRRLQRRCDDDTDYPQTAGRKDCGRCRWNGRDRARRGMHAARLELVHRPHREAIAIDAAAAPTIRRPRDRARSSRRDRTRDRAHGVLPTCPQPECRQHRSRRNGRAGHRRTERGSKPRAGVQRKRHRYLSTSRCDQSNAVCRCRKARNRERRAIESWPRACPQLAHCLAPPLKRLIRSALRICRAVLSTSRSCRSRRRGASPSARHPLSTDAFAETTCPQKPS